MKTRRKNKPLMRAAFFDLDSTITRFDTVFYFLVFYISRRPARIFRVLLFLPAAILFFAHIISSERMKRAMAHIFTGETEASLDVLGRKFLAAVVHGKRLYYPEALQRIAELKKKKYTLILVSASFEFYLTHIADDLGFDHYIGSVLWQHGGRITGKLYGQNCIGIEKVYRIRCEPYGHSVDRKNSIAFSDAASDIPLLSFAGHAVCVNPKRKLADTALKNGWETVRWGKQ
ncbi:MAG: HAD family hydrolase [Spirochaetes bacterium]|nr:HAD family hydrolase [Spirochaetota bacterium]